MPKRDEPRILADLIRLAERKDLTIDALRAARRPGVTDREVDDGVDELEAEYELLEQARAALHRYVVAQGKHDITRREKFWSPAAWWDSAWRVAAVFICAFVSVRFAPGASPFVIYLGGAFAGYLFLGGRRRSS